jgi:hypothetical protein
MDSRQRRALGDEIAGNRISRIEVASRASQQHGFLVDPQGAVAQVPLGDDLLGVVLI